MTEGFNLVMAALAAVYGPPFELMATAEPWVEHTLQAMFLMAVLILPGMVLARSGRSPYWSLLMLVPVVNVIAIWVFAYIRWPGVNSPPR